MLLFKKGLQIDCLQPFFIGRFCWEQENIKW